MILKKGTVVKHGTDFSRLDSIIKNGIKPGSHRGVVKEKEEMTPAIQGVYVANNLSYFGALAAFTACMKENSDFAAGNARKGSK